MGGFAEGSYEGRSSTWLLPRYRRRMSPNPDRPEHVANHIEETTNDALTAAASQAAVAAPGVAVETDLVNHASPANALDIGRRRP